MTNSVLHTMTLTRNTPEDRAAVLAFQCSCLLLSNSHLSLQKALQLNGLGTALGFYRTECNTWNASLGLGLQRVTCTFWMELE